MQGSQPTRSVFTVLHAKLDERARLPTDRRGDDKLHWIHYVSWRVLGVSVSTQLKCHTQLHTHTHTDRPSCEIAFFVTRHTHTQHAKSICISSHMAYLFLLYHDNYTIAVKSSAEQNYFSPSAFLLFSARVFSFEFFCTTTQASTQSSS